MMFGSRDCVTGRVMGKEQQQQQRRHRRSSLVMYLLFILFLACGNGQIFLDIVKACKKEEGKADWPCERVLGA